jgi:hypothetical protein
MKTRSKRFGYYYLGFLILGALSAIGLLLTLIINNLYYLCPVGLFLIYMMVGFNKKFVRWLKR